MPERKMHRSRLLQCELQWTVPGVRPDNLARNVCDGTVGPTALVASGVHHIERDVRRILHRRSECVHVSAELDGLSGAELLERGRVIREEVRWRGQLRHSQSSDTDVSNA